MKIIKFSVNNFRGINGGLDKNCIDFENSNTIFIFGQNNTGKTSFLEAYKFFYHNTEAIEEDFFKKDPNNEIQMEIEAEVDEGDKGRLAEVTKKSAYFEKKYLSSKKRIKIRKTWKEKHSKPEDQTYNPKTNKWDIKAFGGVGLHGVFQVCLPEPISVKAMPAEIETKIVVEQVLAIRAKEFLDNKEREELENIKKQLNELQDKMYDPDNIKKYTEGVNKKFQNLFKDTRIDLDIKDKTKFTPGAIGRDFEVKFNRLEDGKINDRIPSSYDRIGHGAIRTAIFILILMSHTLKDSRGKKDYLVLFEEPELFLHPKLIKILRKLIYQVSGSDTPYQLLCASHSPQMIDITKPKSSLARMIKENGGKTMIFQVDENTLMDNLDKEKVKQELYEAVRFNPFVCESFYADEVVLVEGYSEAIILRAHSQAKEISKDLFVVNCGTVNNIPFFQDVFSKFNIKYHVICDSDGHFEGEYDEFGNPVFKSHIQGSIYKQLQSDYQKSDYKVGLFRIHDKDFEEAHRNIPEETLKFTFNEKDIKKMGKPYYANEYWDTVLEKYLNDPIIDKVPIIKYIKEIISN